MAKCIVIPLCATILLSAWPFAVGFRQLTNPDSMSVVEGGNAGFSQSLTSYFIENMGQVSDEVRYYSRGNPAVAFRDDGVMFVLSESYGSTMNLRETMESHSERAMIFRSIVYMVRFEGANEIKPMGREQVPFDINFFIGNNPSKWKVKVPGFREVIYEDLYDGIDLVYRQDKAGVKYEFRISPGANLGIIKMSFEGIDAANLDSAGLTLVTVRGEVRDSTPYSYEESGKAADCRFAARSFLSFGFECGDYDKSKTLVIDPLVYSTYLGGGYVDAAYGVTVSSRTRAYVTGMTSSVDFPATPGAYDTELDTLLMVDAFVAEMNELGTLPFFVTFLGGSDLDYGYGIALDPAEDIYVTGATSSMDFPTTLRAFQETYSGNSDAFVTKLDASGTFLNYSSFLGGSNGESGYSIAVDAFGNATVTGNTYSANFPVTASAWDKTLDRIDAFVTKVFWTGEWLVYSTLLGGASSDTGYAVAIDSDGNAYVTGETRSADFPTTTDGTDLTFNGTSDAFVTKLNRAGSTLLFSTYLGGNSADAGYSIAVDLFGDAYVTGDTASPDFNIIIGAYDMTFNGGTTDAFVTKLNITNGTLDYSTFLGGSDTDEGRGIAVDGFGVAYVTGETRSTDFPTTRWAYDSTSCSGTWDVFVAKLKSTGDKLIYSTYIASADTEYAHSIAVDPQNGFYVVGETNSLAFPVTPGAFSTIAPGFWDGFLLKLPSLSVGDPPDLMITSGYIGFSPAASVPIGTQVEILAFVHNIGGTNASLIRVRFHDGVPSPANQIGADYIIPTIEYFNGVGTAHASWDALVLGLHSICVVVDPEKEIDEINENNNQACAPIRVFLPPTPDLVLTASNISFVPPAPVIEGTNVTINATIWNAGGAQSGQTFARFLDGGPTSRRIGPDQFVDFIASGGTAIVSMLWNTSRVGNHIICVAADPDNAIIEANENNNVACVDYEVLAPGVFRADYVPTQPDPPSPVRVALSSPLTLSVRVLNAGNATPSSNATVAFYNELLPNFPFAEFKLPPLDPSNTSSRFTATWTSPATPGTHHLVANVDYENNVTEWNENNNIFVWTVDVVTGPVTSLVIGSPNYSNPLTFVKSSTPLDFSFIDQSGLGMRNTTYTIDGGAQVNYTATGIFFLAGEGEHTVEWRSLDWAGNLEELNSKVLRVDDIPPVTTLTIGDLRYLVGGNFVTSSTPLTLLAVDGGVTPVGLDYSEYRVDGGNWKTYSSPFSLAGEDAHDLKYRSCDLLGNSEAVQSMQMVVDDSPPATAISIGEP